jgi:L-alanine-DL-glutamate epimerase-like enolase superfamily enzyme
MVWRWFGVRIEDMKVFVVNPIAAEKFEGIGHLYRRGGINYVVVKVLTDEGVYGVGEGTLHASELAVVATVNHLKELLIGKDPRNTRRHLELPAPGNLLAWRTDFQDGNRRY